MLASELHLAVPMAGVRNFAELVAWQLANELRGHALNISLRPKAARHARFREQLTDAASSAPRNIAEGFGRFRPREFAHFVRIAKASECEVLDLLSEARQRSLISEAEYDEYALTARRAIAAATGLIRYLERKAETSRDVRRKRDSKHPNDP